MTLTIFSVKKTLLFAKQISELYNNNIFNNIVTRNDKRL